MAFLSPQDVNSIVAEFEPYEPGLSIAEIQARFGLDRVVKLASNENMRGLSPIVRQILHDKAHLAFRYPQAGNPRLKTALAEHLGVRAEQIFIGNGSDEVIDLLFRVRSIPGTTNAVAFEPCFGLYVTQSKMAGVELRQARLRSDFSFDFTKLSSLIDANTSLVFVTSPDNPSGRIAPVAELTALAGDLPPGCLLVIDEAYIEFAGEEHSLLRRLAELSNVALLRTFSKVYGLAGLRIGYGIFPGRLADYMWRVRLPFSLNTLAEEAALAALGDTEYFAETLRLTREGRACLGKELERLGCVVVPSHSNFLMFSPPPCISAADLHARLLRQGIILRSLRSYKLHDWLRLTIGLPEENQFFIQACSNIVRDAR